MQGIRTILNMNELSEWKYGYNVTKNALLKDEKNVIWKLKIQKSLLPYSKDKFLLNAIIEKKIPFIQTYC